MPTPYEYALLSQAIYLDDLSVPGGAEPLPDKQRVLQEKGWQLLEFIRHPSDYIAGIWVNRTQRQIVITHRGSQNATSWITDIESVIQLKPGSFVKEAIDVLAHDEISKYRSLGYRLSTTGHSLGGFLAQVCLFWSQRSEFTKMHYPEMSAVVFDSPGAGDFLEVIQPKLVRERIDLKRLNVHNFCGMPTIVSTYGRQLGTIWHLKIADEIQFDFVMAHKMEHIIEGFDSSTGLPTQFRQMSDWPQANYSQFETWHSAATTVVSTTVRAPFDFLNGLYQKCKLVMGQPYTPTHFEQIFKSDGAVQRYLRETQQQGRRPELDRLVQQLNFALHAHYVPLSPDISMKQIDLCHFTEAEQQVLQEVEEGRKAHPDLGWSTALEEKYGRDGVALLYAFKLQRGGERIKLDLIPEYPRSIFEFQEDLFQLIRERGLISFEHFTTDTLQQTREKLTQLQGDLRIQQNLSKPLREMVEEKQASLEKKIAALEAVQRSLQAPSTEQSGSPTSCSTVSIRTAIALEEASCSLRVLSREDFENEERRTRDLIAVIGAKSGQSVEMDCARANKKDSFAVVGTPEAIAALHRHGVFRPHLQQELQQLPGNALPPQ